MNLTTLLNQMRFRLGNRKNLDEQLKGELYLAQRSLELDPKLNLYFLSRSFVFQTYTTEVAYPMPQDFVKMNELQQPYFMDPNESITKMTRKRADQIFKPSVIEPPRFYDMQALMMVTSSKADGVIRIFYFGVDDELTEEKPSNNWTRFAPNVIMLKALMNVAKTLRDMDLFNTTTAEYNIEYDNLYRMCVAQEDYGFDLARGENNE